jgi:hypothetical protein
MITLSNVTNDLFDVYCSYKEAKDIWELMATMYTAEDAGKQKFVIGNYYRWEMVEDKDIKVHINEYHKPMEDLKAKNITLLDSFLLGSSSINFLNRGKATAFVCVMIQEAFR